MITLQDLKEATFNREKQAQRVLGLNPPSRQLKSPWYLHTLLKTDKYELVEIWAWGYNPQKLEICIFGYRIKKFNEEKNKWFPFKDYDTLQYAYDNFQCFSGLIKPEQIRPSESISKNYA